LRKVAKEHQFKVQELSAPFKFGEDFGLFTTKFKGAMFGLGAGENHPELHNPDYDFPDEIAPIGIQMFESLIREIAESD
jgi:metal-dependent amidase/aminoacylase/carboxypeptidase family protein